MSFSQGTRGIIRALAVVLSVALPLAMAISAADARVGGGGSSGSRGSKTYSAPPSTTTAPGAAQRPTRPTISRMLMFAPRGSDCQRYLPAARRPQIIDTGMSHIGIRCVRRER